MDSKSLFSFANKLAELQFCLQFCVFRMSCLTTKNDMTPEIAEYIFGHVILCLEVPTLDLRVLKILKHTESKLAYDHSVIVRDKDNGDLKTLVDAIISFDDNCEELHKRWHNELEEIIIDLRGKAEMLKRVGASQENTPPASAVATEPCTIDSGNQLSNHVPINETHQSSDGQQSSNPKLLDVVDINLDEKEMRVLRADGMYSDWKPISNIQILTIEIIIAAGSEGITLSAMKKKNSDACNLTLTKLCNNDEEIKAVFDRPGQGSSPRFKYKLKDPRLNGTH